MVLISSSPSPSNTNTTTTTNHNNNNNEWTLLQDNQFNVQKSGGSFRNMASLAPLPPPLPPPSRVLDQKVANYTQEQQQQKQQQQSSNNNNNNNNQEALRCPRCDSSNTKFCYYNNYSLSQPRHFCKACKRYWTRGGTLRSVPVGGGCRKNKRVKRYPNNSSSNTTTTTNPTSNINHNTNYTTNLHDGSVNSLPSSNHIHDLITSSNSNPLFYGTINHHHDHNLMNFPFSRYDHHPSLSQMNGVGLGFSSLGLMHNDVINNGDFRNGLGLNPHNNNNNNNNKHIFQDLISSPNPLLLSTTNNTNTTTSSTNNTNPSTISSLLASSFQMKSGNNFGTILPSSYEGRGMFMKEVKMEVEGQNRVMDHHHHHHHQWSGSVPSQSEVDHHRHHHSLASSPNSSCDPSHVWGDGPNLGSWLDSSLNNNNNNNNNLGASSFPSLI